MRNLLRFVVMSAALSAGLAVTGGSRADAGVSFSGTFPLPHGQISIGIGDPYFHAGAFVPYGYQVYARSGYGYGFAYNDRWIPVRRYSNRWQVCGSPYFDDVYYTDVHYDANYGAGYGGYYGGYYVRPSHRYAYRGGYSQSYSQQHYAPYDYRDQNGNGHQGHGSRGSRDQSRNDRRYDGDRRNGNGHGNGNGEGHRH